VAGVLSGTSADGIDVALLRVRVDGGEGAACSIGCAEVLAFETRPFPAALAQRVRAALDGESDESYGATALLSRDLGIAFGEAALALADGAHHTLDLVGSHGQTVYHHDGAEPGARATLQLGEGAEVAEASGATVVSDFRQRDLAADGEGAPIAALVDDDLFHGVERPVAILNLGGIANLTLLGERGASEGPLSFDVGPAGSLLDGLARRLLDRPFDAGGEEAARGSSDAALLSRLLEHPFLGLPAPKSTGRDTFGEAWIDAVMEGVGVDSAQNLLATATEFVARTVAAALAAEGPRIRGVLVAGGGVHHLPLMESLRDHCGCPVESTWEAKIDPDAREAMAFALLAARAVLGIPSTRTRATGAREGRILGQISLPEVKSQIEDAPRVAGGTP